VWRVFDASVVVIVFRSGVQVCEVRVVCLDGLVAEGDVLRGVGRLVSGGTVRGTGRLFCSDVGGPGVDLVVLVGVFLVAAVRGVDSVWEMMWVAGVGLLIRRLLG
jgi:hypothetical protein